MNRLPTCLLFWDAEGNVIGTIESMVQYDGEGRPLGLVDFETHELAGGRLREIAEVDVAVGAGTWPEWLGAQAHDFRVEVRPGTKGGTPSIQALVHRQSGHRRERAAIEDAIKARFAEATRGRVVDMRDVIGSPSQRLELEADGRNKPPFVPVRPTLPLREVVRAPDEVDQVTDARGPGGSKPPPSAAEETPAPLGEAGDGTEPVAAGGPIVVSDELDPVETDPAVETVGAQAPNTRAGAARRG